MAWHQATSLGWSPLADVAAIRESGHKLMAAWRPKVDDFGAAATCDLILEQGVKVSSLSWIGGFLCADHGDFLGAIDDARDAVADAVELSTPTLVCVTGPRLGHTWSHARRMLVDGLRRVADLAAEHGIQLAVSPVDPGFSPAKNPTLHWYHTLDLLEKCAHPTIGLNLDTFGLTPSAEFWNWLPEATRWVRNVQFREDHTVPVPAGRVTSWCDLVPGVVTHLEAHRYTGAYEVVRLSPAVWRELSQQTLQQTYETFHALLESAGASPVISTPEASPLTAG